MPFKYNDNLLKKSRVYNVNKEKNNLYYHVDYAISHYPFGDLSDVLYIMHDDIKDVIHLGYDDEYRKNILNDIDRWNRNEGDING